MLPAEANPESCRDQRAQPYAARRRVPTLLRRESTHQQGHAGRDRSYLKTDRLQEMRGQGDAASAQAEINALRPGCDEEATGEAPLAACGRRSGLLHGRGTVRRRTRSGCVAPSLSRRSFRRHRSRAPLPMISEYGETTPISPRSFRTRSRVTRSTFTRINACPVTPGSYRAKSGADDLDHALSGS